MVYLSIPPIVQQILQRFDQHGFRGYVVGGCVRDSLLGKAPTDWDICTNALPEQTKQIFADCRLIETGIAHGTVTVLFDNQPFEITTFRLESGYSDHRRPDSIRFCTDLQQDLARRDFTINAMAYHPAAGLVDPFGGQEDLAQHTLRCVGQAEERFEEDALRILRAMRFLAQLGFSADDCCCRAMLQKKHLLQTISSERIFSEVSKLLMGNFCADVIAQFADTILQLFPSLSPASVQDAAAFIRHSCNRLPIRYALLLHSLTEKAASEELRRLKADNRLREDVCLLIKHIELPIVCERIFIKKQLHKLGEGHFLALLDFLSALHFSDKEMLQTLDRTSLLAQQVLREHPCLQLSQLALSGKDLMQMGYPQGKMIGELLNALLNAVLEEKTANTPNALKAYLSQIQMTEPL